MSLVYLENKIEFCVILLRIIGVYKEQCVLSYQVHYVLNEVTEHMRETNIQKKRRLEKRRVKRTENLLYCPITF